MARRKKYNDEISKNSGGVGYSQAALDKLNAGTYGRDIGSKRQVQYRTSQEQTQQSRQLPVLEGLTRSNDWDSSNKVDTVGARQRYAEKNNYKPIGRSLSNEDEELLYKTFDRNRLSSGGNAAIVHQLKNNIWNNTRDWEEKYGKTIEQIVEDYSKDYEKIAEKRNTEKGKNNKVLTTLTNTLRGGTVEPALDTMSTLAGKVAPNNPLTRAYRDAAEKYSKQKKQTVEGVTGNMSGVGKQAYELGTGLGERALQYANPSALKYVLTAGKTAENTRQSLKERGIEGTNAEIQSGLAGLVDAGLDIVGLESVPALKGLVDSGNIGKEVLGRMAIGGGEQALTEFINRMIDRSNGDKSLHNVAVQNYMSHGMSAEDAEKQANIDDVLGVAQASVSGGLLNNIMGFGGRMLGNVPSLFKRSDTTRVDVPETESTQPDVIKAAQAQQAQAMDNINRLSEQIPDNSDRLSVEEMRALGLDDETINRQLEIYNNNQPGNELKAAQDRVSSNKAQIKALENEIKVIESDPNNKYRGNLKKSAKADIENRKAQIAELKQDNKVTTRQIKGEPTPVIEQLDADSVTRINDFKKEVRKIGNMWGGENGKQLAKDVNDALDRYIETGSQEDFNTFARDLWQLHSSANGEYTSKAGNVSRYSDYYGDIEDGIFGASIKDNGMLPQKAIRDFHNARTMNESVGGNPTLTSEVPPTNNGANDEVTTPGNRRTSQYYTNTMRNTPTNVEMDDAEYGARFNRDEYGYITSSHKETDAKSNQFIQESGGDDATIDRILSDDFTGDDSFDAVHIDAAEKLADKVERQAKDLEAQGQDATEQWMLANRLHKKIRENGTIHAKGLEILKKWKQSTPQGQVDYIVTEVNKSVDSHKTKGYTKMVNNMADDVEDAILNSPDKNTLISNIKKIFANNRANSDYKTEKYEQLVLDLVGGEDFGKRSPASIAEEAGALIKRQMGVSSLTAKQERAMIDLFEQASRYEQNSRAYNECIGRAMDILDSTLPSSFGNKARSLAYDNMLISLKTMLTRNLGGNVLANAIETTSRPLQVLADVVASGVTKKRTRTLTGNSIVEGGKGFGKGVKDWYLDVKQGINTTRSGQGSLEDALNAAHKTFKTQSTNRVIKGVNTALGGYDRVVRKGMELGDRPIYEMRYAATKAELLDVVDKFGDEGLRKGFPEGKDVSTDELIELIAVNEGLEAVLQNDSTLKEGAKALKKAISKTSEDILGVDVATMSTTPFVEVPANMASRFFQYTPLGIVGNIVRSIGEKVKTGAVNQRRMTGEAGRNALGLLMQAGAMGLAANNYISDPYSEDPNEKKIQQNNDYIEYALQTPDGERQTDLSDVPNLGPMLRYGKMQYNALQEGGIPGHIGNIPNAAGAATVDTLYQGLNKLTGATNKYSSGDSMLSNAKNAIVSSIGSMIIPAFIRQTAQFHDPYKRDLGDYGTSEYNKNLIINGLPVLRETMLNPKIGTSGEPVKQTGGDASFSKFFNTYIAPWKMSTPKENMSEAQRYAEMLKEQTDGKVNPQPPVFNAKDLKGIKGYDKENYTHEDLYDIDRKLYKYNNDVANKLIGDEWYRSLSPEKQGRYLDMLYSSGKEVVKEDFARKGMTADEIEKAGKDIYTVDSKLAKILKEDDDNLTGMKDYFHNLDGIENLEEKYGYKMDYDTYVKWNTDPDKKSLGGAEKYAEAHDAAKELDMNVEDYLKKEAEQPGGAQAFVENKQAAIDAGFVKKDGTANIKGYEKVISQAGEQSQKFVNDLPMLQQTGLEKSAYYTYANAINVIPSLTPSEFAQTYNEINTNTSNAMTQKELLDYLNKYQFSDDPAEDKRIANELWRAYGGWKSEAGVEKKIKLQNGQWKSYY